MDLCTSRKTWKNLGLGVGTSYNGKRKKIARKMERNRYSGST